MKTAYFTFGQIHHHVIDGVFYDKNGVVKITAEEPREWMFELFGPKWSIQYDEPPNMLHFPRGIIGEFNFSHQPTPKTPPNETPKTHD